MKKPIVAFLAVLVLFLPAGAGAQNESAQGVMRSDPGTYKIGVNDVLDVNVIKPDRYETTLTVAPDGTISFPYIGNVMVKDRSLQDIQREIADRLSEFAANPVVTVALKESKSLAFYIYGEVSAPGSYPHQDNLTIIRAISMAGGFTKFASAGKVNILRQNPDGSTERIKANVKAAMQGSADQDVKVRPGDVITVSEGFF